MAIKPLNSIAGYSVGGNSIANIILANGDITTNNITTTGVANLGNVGNVVITGGSANYILKTDGSGNLSWTATFIVPNTSGTSQQVLGITDQSTQQLGWKTVPVNYVTVELRNTYSYLSSPVPVLRVYPIRTRSGTFLDLTVTQ